MFLEVCLHTVICGVLVYFPGFVWNFLRKLCVASSDSNGCVIIDSIFINQPNQLIANIVNDSLGLTGSVTGGVSPYIYDFYSPSGLYLTTSNSQGSDVTISTTNVGYYSLVITDANGS